MLQYLKLPKHSDLHFLHITDCHLMDHRDDLFHQQNTRSNLQRVIQQSISSYPDIDFILITGDISQTGTPASYEVFKSIIGAIDIPIYAVPGNHDDPALLQRVIATSPDQSISIIHVKQYSLLLASSWVKDKHYGRISEQSLEQIEQQLKSSDGGFNIIAIHHPPVVVGSQWLDNLGLKNGPELLKLVNASSAKSLIICGHVHQEINRELGQSGLLATPSTCHQFQPHCDSMQRINEASPAYRYVSISNGQMITTKIHYLNAIDATTHAPVLASQTV